MNDNDIIHVHIWEPHKGGLFGKVKKTEKAEMHIYTCPKASECEVYSKGECINVGNVFGAKCHVGRKHVITGYSQKARKYYTTIYEWKDEYKRAYNALKSAPKMITRIPGGWFLPYNHMGSGIIGWNGDHPCFKGGAPFLEDITKEHFNTILEYKPRSIFGDEMVSYQKETVPKFIKDFNDKYPEKFKEVSEGNIMVSEVLKDYNYVGRKAYLITLKPGVDVKLGTGVWHWDGKKISKRNNHFMLFEPTEWESCYAEFTPKHTATVKITSNDQVCDTTRLAD